MYTTLHVSEESSQSYLDRPATLSLHQERELSSCLWFLDVTLENYQQGQYLLKEVLNNYHFYLFTKIHVLINLLALSQPQSIEYRLPST